MAVLAMLNGCLVLYVLCKLPWFVSTVHVFNEKIKKQDEVRD